MIDFEERTDEQQNMVIAVKKFLGELISARNNKKETVNKEEKGDTKNELMDIMNKAMAGDMAQYLGMFLSTTKGGLPFKTDAARLLAVNIGDTKAGGIAMPKQMYLNNPTKYGLTAMALAGQRSWTK